MASDDVRAQVEVMLDARPMFDQMIEAAIQDFTMRLDDGVSEEEIMGNMAQAAIEEPDLMMAIGVMITALLRLARIEQRKQLTLSRLGRPGNSTFKTHRPR